MNSKDRCWFCLSQKTAVFGSLREETELPVKCDETVSFVRI